MDLLFKIVKFAFWLAFMQVTTQPQDVTFVLGILISIVALLANFATVVTLFVNIKNKVAEHDKRFDVVDKRFDTIDKKLDRIDTDINQFGRMDERLKHIEGKRR